MDGAKIDLTPGSISSLPTGVDFSEWSPQYPNNEFDAFMKVMLRQASVGFSIPYSDISGDLSDVNYSSMRQGALEIRANYQDTARAFDSVFHETCLYGMACVCADARNADGERVNG